MSISQQDSVILDLFSNPKKIAPYLEELRNTIAQIEKSRKEANDAIALVAPAQDILRLREEAQKDADAAKEALAQAQHKCNLLTESTHHACEEMVSQARLEASQIMQAVEKTLREVNDAKNSAEGELLEARKAKDLANKEGDLLRAEIEKMRKATDDAATSHKANLDRNQELEKKVSLFLQSLRE